MASPVPLDVLEEISGYLTPDMLVKFSVLDKTISSYIERRLYQCLRVNSQQADKIMSTSSHHLVHTTGLHITIATYPKSTSIAEFIEFIARHGQLQFLTVVSKYNAFSADSKRMVAPALRTLLSSSPHLCGLDIFLDHRDHTLNYSSFLQDALTHPKLRLVALPLAHETPELLQKLKAPPNPTELEVNLSESSGMFGFSTNREIRWSLIQQSLSLSRLETLTIRNASSQSHYAFYIVAVNAVNNAAKLTRLNLDMTESQLQDVLPKILSCSTQLIHLSIVTQSSLLPDLLLQNAANGLSQLTADTLEVLEFFIPSWWKSFAGNPLWSRFTAAVQNRRRLQLFRLYFGGAASMSQEDKHRLTLSMASDSLRASNIFFIENAELSDMWPRALTLK
ncbi:hypothetical protein DL96DRAFT_1676726, partial [Flagelloscypha sp. PMI_526]